MSIPDERDWSRPLDVEPGWRQARAAFRILCVVLAVAFGLWLVLELRTIILLLVFSIFFAYLVAPLVDLVGRPFTLRARERRLSAGLSVGVVYLLLGGFLIVALGWLLPVLAQQATQMAAQAPQYVHLVQQRSESLTSGLDRMGLAAANREALQGALAAVGRSLEGGVRGFVLGIVGLLAYVPWLVLIPILAFFLLKDADSFREAAICLLPAGRVRVNAIQLFARINLSLAAYVRAQLLACLIIGAVVTLGFALLGVPYGLVLGAVAGLAEFIPLVGPVVVALAAAVLTAIHSPFLALWVLLFLGVLRIVEDYVIYPRLVGTVVDLHPLAVILAVLAGAELGGVAGVFLSVPVVAILSAAYRQYRDYTRISSSSRGADTPLRPTSAADRPMP
jgi:predicted PurR-regulated permease PerM